MRLTLCISTIILLLATALPGCASTPADRNAGVGDSATKGSIADPDFLEQYAATYRFRLGDPASVAVTPDGDHALFLRSGPRSFVRDLYEHDVATGETRVLLTADRLLGGEEEELSEEEKARRERMRLAARGIASFQLSKDGRRLLIPLSGRLFVMDRDGERIKELESDAGYAIDPQFSPDGRKVACVRNGDLYVTDIESGAERRLTRSGGERITNGLAEFVAQEEMKRRHGYWWSPDSRRIVYQRTDTSELETMHIADATTPEQPPATWPYPRPGKVNATVRLGVIPSTGGESTWIDWDNEAHEYLATVRWVQGAPLTILVQNRRQTEQVLLSVDPDSGATAPLLTERDDAWINLEQQAPLWITGEAASIVGLGEPGFIWFTERNGARQLELRNARGGLVRELTPTSLEVRSPLHFDSSSGELFFTASTDPTETHIHVVDLSTDAISSEPKRLTVEPGSHAATFAEKAGTHVHMVNGMQSGQRWIIRNDLREAIGALESVAETPPFRPAPEFTTVGRSPKLHTAVIRPRNFDPERTYPIIVHVYGGPTSQMVTKTPSRYLLDQWMADHGHIVVAIDGRGTPGRGRDWQRTVKNNLIDLPLEDQVRGVQLLAKKYDEMDPERVGIYGWSFGGYFSAMAVMRRPDVFDVGVAGAPVVDWRDYDTHYTERYMDLPQTNPAGYEASNVLTYADQLERPLLIIHGTADDNVYFTHSLKLADALFRAGKDFDFLPLPGFTHMVPDPLVTQRLYGRIMDLFERNLKD